MVRPFRYIIFEAGQKCNLACKYCYNVWHAVPGLKHKPSTYGRKTFKTLKKMVKTLRPGHITFSGGEPFLEKRLLEMVLFCRLKKISVSIISNGTCGSKDDYQYLAGLRVQHMQFPLLSASPEIHDSLTGVPGSWERAKASLQQAVELGGREVAVFVLTMANYREFAPTVELLSGLGIKQLMIARFNIGGRGIQWIKELALNSAAIRSVFTQADTFAAEGVMRISSNVCLPLCVLDPASYPHLHISSCSSDLYNRPVTIDAEGNMRLCNHSPVVVGNIHRQTPEELLSQPYCAQWQSLKPAFCSSCDKWESCQGGCRAASEQLGFNLKQEDPWIGMIERKQWEEAAVEAV